MIPTRTRDAAFIPLHSSAERRAAPTHLRLLAEGGTLTPEHPMKSACLVLAIALPLAAAGFRVYQTNSAGDSVSVIDPATNQIVMEVKGIEAPHGVAFSPDGKRAYITCEAD